MSGFIFQVFGFHVLYFGFYICGFQILCVYYDFIFLVLYFRLLISGFRIQCSVFRSEICELGLSWEREAGGTELGENFGLETLRQVYFSQFFEVLGA